MYIYWCYVGLHLVTNLTEDTAVIKLTSKTIILIHMLRAVFEIE